VSCLLVVPACPAPPVYTRLVRLRDRDALRSERSAHVISELGELAHEAAAPALLVVAVVRAMNKRYIDVALAHFGRSPNSDAACPGREQA
jgi:hypothetical protein